MNIIRTFVALAAGASIASAQAAPPRPASPPSVTVPERPAPSPRTPAPGLPWVGAPLTVDAFAPAFPIEIDAPLAALPSMSWSLVTPELPAMPVMPLEWSATAVLPSLEVMPALPVEPVLAPLAPTVVWETPPMPAAQGTPTRPDRMEARIRAEEARVRAEMMALDREVQRELVQSQRILQHEQESRIAEQAHAIAAQHDQIVRQSVHIADQARAVVEHNAWSIGEGLSASFSASVSGRFSESVRVPEPWAKQDVGDSVYRQARELFNRGEWGQAAAAFRALPERFPNSTYASEAGYYEAFALYRIGGTPELRQALATLDAWRAKYPNARSRTEATNLTTRIRGTLAERGDAQAAAALAATANQQEATCDKEEQAVQAEAMNALSRSDAANVNELITRVLARKDECSVPLRRTAVFLVGNRRDAQAVTILAGVARTDPSNSVKIEAINVIGRLPSDEGAVVLEELARGGEDDVQRAAVRALVRHPSARARQYIRALVERDDISERVRSEALSAFNAERATGDDIAWLRALYAKVQSPTLKSRTLSAIVRVGGPDVDQWLVTIASSESERSELRATAMRRIGASMSIADLGRLYDAATQQRFRREIISVLGKRTEDGATDKLITIVKDGTDPSLRTSAISALAGKNDARATALLLEIINK